MLFFACKNKNALFLKITNAAKRGMQQWLATNGKTRRSHDFCLPITIQLKGALCVGEKKAKNVLKNVMIFEKFVFNFSLQLQL